MNAEVGLEDFAQKLGGGGAEGIGAIGRGGARIRGEDRLENDLAGAGRVVAGEIHDVR